ncbi:MAG: hypothetical protein ABI615_04835 [Chthoniobacterales bacterium]
MIRIPLIILSIFAGGMMFLHAETIADIPSAHRAIHEGKWKPRPEQVQKGLSQLSNFLKTNDTFSKWQKENIPKILIHSESYYVQTWGIIAEEKKLMEFNFFIPPSDMKEGYRHWRESAVLVDGGGYHYWGIKYDPILKQYSGFHVNGPL